LNVDNDVDTAGMPDHPGSTRWIYSADSPGGNGGPPAQYGTTYLSFNTPTTSPLDQQCGRAVFSDVHLVATQTDAKTFPDECTSASPTTEEQALTFLFFDLSSCVQDDTKPPPPPPPPNQ
jgi:hypothetical protein